MLAQKPVDRWLQYGSIAVGLVFYLLPKTPSVVVICLLLIFALLIHPIWNFWWIEKSAWRRITALGVTAFLLTLIALAAWPEPTITPALSPASSLLSRVIDKALLIFNYIRSWPWRWILFGALIGAVGCFLTLFIWFQRKAESKASEVERDKPPSEVQDKVLLECLAARDTKVSVAEKGGWSKSGKKPLDAITLVIKNLADYIFYPLVARIAFYRSDGQFCFQVNKAEWLEAGKVREVLLGVGASRELLVLWQLYAKETYASGESDRLDLGSCGNAIRAVVTFIAGRNETRIGEFEFEITLDPLSVKRQTETQNKSEERINEWLHRIAEGDKALIKNLVKVVYVFYRPDFDQFHIDFAFGVFNNSLYDIMIDDLLQSGSHIMYGPDQTKFHYPPKIMQDKPIYCPSRWRASFTVRQPIRQEGPERQLQGVEDVGILFHGLNINFKGADQLTEIGTTQLDTQQYLETRKGYWSGDDPQIAFGYTEEQWAAICSGSVENAAEVKRLRTKINSLKAAPGSEALTEIKQKPRLTFLRIDEVMVYHNEINNKITEYENKPRTADWRLKHPSFTILVAYFRNTPDESRQPELIQSVTAELTYNGTDESYVVPRGLWFPENTTAIDIPYNDARGVIIAEHHRSETIYGRDKNNAVELNVREQSVSVRFFVGTDGAMIEGGKFKIESSQADHGFDFCATKIS